MTTPKDAASMAVEASTEAKKVAEEKKELFELNMHYTKQAVTLHNLVLGKEFTLHDIRTHNKCDYAGAKKFIRLLHQFGFINETVRNKRSYFKVTLDKKLRAENLKKLKESEPTFAPAIDQLLTSL